MNARLDSIVAEFVISSDLALIWRQRIPRRNSDKMSEENAASSAPPTMSRRFWNSMSSPAFWYSVLTPQFWEQGCLGRFVPLCEVDGNLETD